MNGNERYLLAPWHKKRILEEMYYERMMSTYDIARYYNCHPSTIRKWMIKHDLERREQAGTSRRFNGRMYKNRHYLRQQYLTLKLSVTEIAKKEGTSGSSVRRWLIKFNIPRRHGLNQHIIRKMREIG